jgi:thymidylate synthase ThyX
MQERLKTIHIRLTQPFQADPPEEKNELGLSKRDIYRTGDVAKLLGISPDAFRWRFRNGWYRSFKIDQDKRGIRLTIDQLREIANMGKNRPR